MRCYSIADEAGRGPVLGAHGVRLRILPTQPEGSSAERSALSSMAAGLIVLFKLSPCMAHTNSHCTMQGLCRLEDADRGEAGSALPGDSRGCQHGQCGGRAWMHSTISAQMLHR